jgi:hypothetical protein
MALEPCGVEVVGLPVRRGFKGTLKTYAAAPEISRVLCSRLTLRSEFTQNSPGKKLSE